MSWWPFGQRTRRTIGVSQKGKREINDAGELARIEALKMDARYVGEFLDDMADVSDEERAGRKALAKMRKKR